MSSSRHISDHLKAVRKIATETSPEDVAGTVALAIQRVRITLQNLSLLANRTSELDAAARRVDACLPTYSGGQWSGVFFGDALLKPWTTSRWSSTPPAPAKWPGGSAPGRSGPPRLPGWSPSWRPRVQAASMIARKSAAFSEAPPTSAPPTSGAARISRAFSGFTDPP